MSSPFHREVVTELAAACKKQQIQFGAYYSITDRHHPGWLTISTGASVLVFVTFDTFAANPQTTPSK